MKSKKHQSSTQANYLSIWRQFNNFVIRLDKKPSLWEDRVSLFGAYLVDKGIQSSTIRCYVSAIKSILVDDGYQWNDQKVLLSTLTRSARILNDKVYIRLPIHIKLLEIMLFEIERLYESQPYLQTLYKAIFRNVQNR